MTREEAVIILDGFKNNPLFSDTHVQALDMAISALSENNGDLISRQAVLELVANYDLSMGQVVKGIHALPSVENKGESKTGHWISNAEDDLKISEYTCSNCKGLSDEDFDFCPKCGADMRGET